MIENMTIKNFGLIDKLSIDFTAGLNIFTGETGAGKSILIDALRYALGEKLSLESVRDRSKNCVVEAVFQLNDKKFKTHPLLCDYIEEDNIIINRTYTPNGKSKNKINGLNVTVAILKSIGNNLVDLHGPHDHQMLFSQDQHLKMLDRMCDLDELKEQYAKEYSIYQDYNTQLKKLEKLAQTSAAELDILSYQIKELEQVPLDENHYLEIKDKISRINNVEKLYSASNNILSLIENDTAGISALLEEVFSSIKNLNKIDESTKDLSVKLENAQENIASIQNEISTYIDNLSFEPEQAEHINNTYDTYYEILKKYGPEIEDAKNFYLKAKAKYDTIIDLEHSDKDLRRNISESKRTAEKTAQRISQTRKIQAKELSQIIESELKQLGIENVLFECKVEKTDLNPTGKDDVSFYISPNKGEDLKPLAKIVSSGEAARVMLALKKALTKADPIPSLIFDEIDAQIGGRLGTITGKKLKDLSLDRQVILITHLPQIASFAKSHFKVEKMIKEGRTYTTVKTLDHDMIITELAHMMSGQIDSEIAKKHAKDMLLTASNQ